MKFAAEADRARLISDTTIADVEIAVACSETDAVADAINAASGNTRSGTKRNPNV